MAIENHYALGAGYPLQQALDFGVIDRFDLIGIVKVLDRSFALCEQESVRVERESAKHFATVADGMLDVFSRPAEYSGRRIIGIVDRLRCRLSEVIQLRGHCIGSCAVSLQNVGFRL